VASCNGTPIPIGSASASATASAPARAGAADDDAQPADSTPYYDANGNTVNDENGNTLVYNAWNQIVSVTNSAGVTIAGYSYDALGRRISDIEAVPQSTGQAVDGGPSFTVNNGSVQRSMVWSLTVNFASPVTLGAGAITLYQEGVGPISITQANPSNDGKTYVITFSGSEIIGGSLPDGAYALTVHSGLVTVNSTGLALAAPNQSFNFYRLFGDVLGHGIMDADDFNEFIVAYGARVGSRHYNADMDFNSDGVINAVDFNELLPRYDVAQPCLSITDFYYSDRGQVIEEQQNGQATTQYVWSPFYVNQLVERDDQPNAAGTLTRRLYVEQDANYNVTSLTDSAGNVIERYVYDPYGTVTVLNPDGSIKGDGTLASSSYGMAYLFQGGRIDPATGFYLFGIRDDDPATGTWKEQDPDGYVNGANRYQLEAGSPSTFVDPSGLFLQTAAPLVGETVGGAAVPVLIAGRSVAIVIDGSAWGYEAYEYHQFAQPLPGYPVPPQPTSQPASPASQPSSPTGDPGTGAQPSNQQQDEPPPEPAPEPQTPDRNPDDSPDVPSGQETTPTTTSGDDGSGANTKKKLRPDTNMKDAKTWPQPPGKKGPYTAGPPSRSKPDERGQQSLYDSDGGEWRPHLPDSWHDTEL
jgi:RHS repeat-associated protein